VPSIAVRPKPSEITSHRLCSTDWKHRHALELEITSPSPGQCFDGDLIADALDNDDRVGGVCLAECGLGGSNRRARTVRPFVEP
jgi:hypothetical protein